MIRILMLDLGDTLIRGDSLLPHSRQALEAIRGLETASGEALTLSLVSDFHMPTPPGSPEEIDRIFLEYLAVLDRFDLRSFFEPVGRHVTLSTHVGVYKPDRRVFEAAVSRLGMDASLDECLFVTENARHVRVCREELGMSVLRFGEIRGEGVDFDDWSDAPLLVAHRLDPGSELNLERALRTKLAASHGLKLFSVDRAGKPR